MGYRCKTNKGWREGGVKEGVSAVDHSKQGRVDWTYSHTFLLPSSSSSSRAPPLSSPRMGLCSGEGVWPGRLRVDIWKEGDRQMGPLGLRGESWGLSTESGEGSGEKFS